MQKVGKDDEEELPDSSTAAAALAPESNVEHIKQMQEKMDTGVLDGVANESDRILGKKNKKGKGGKKSKNMFVKDGCSCSSDTAMELEEAKLKIAELEEKLGACKANVEDVGYYGDGEGGGELEELIAFIPDGGGGLGVASSGSVPRYGYCNIDNSFRDCYGGKKWFFVIYNPNVSLTIFITMLFHM